MISVSNQSKAQSNRLVGKSRSFTEVVEFLDQLVAREYAPAVVERMKMLDHHLGGIASTLNTVLIGGTNGKSLTMHFASKLFKEEKVSVTAIHASHFLTYNERLTVDGRYLPNKALLDPYNKVINAAAELGITCTASELSLMAGLLYARELESDIVLVEVGVGGQYDASAICKPIITAVTRVTSESSGLIEFENLDQLAQEYISLARTGVRFISAEQSKIRLQKMRELVEARGAIWEMPTRKLAPLPYMYEQLYGRVAALGERIVQIYVEEIQQKFSPFLRGNLLATKRGQRGRPTLEAKRNAELNPIKTMKQFWLEDFDLLRGRFEVLDREKPTIVLDNASNLDALENTFLGLRLMHYQHIVNGFIIVVGLRSSVNDVEAVKAIRYLLKKSPGMVYFAPLSQDGHNPKDLLALAQSLNMPAKAFDTFSAAFDAAKEQVDDRDGLVAVAGDPELVRLYWKHKGLKKVT